MRNEKGKKWWQFSEIGTDIKTAQKQRQEQSSKRFEQLVNGEALVFHESKCELKVKPKVKPASLTPDAREQRKISYHYESYIVGNRRVGRRRKTVRTPMELYEVLDHQFQVQGNQLYHPRTSELIKGTSLLERQPEVFTTDKLSVITESGDLVKLRVYKDGKPMRYLVKPYTPYHQQKNRQVSRNYKFTVEPTRERRSPLEVEHLKITPKVYDRFNQEWKPTEAERVKFRKTNQRRSVWYTGNSRRK